MTEPRRSIMQIKLKVSLYWFSLCMALAQMAIAETGSITTTGKVMDDMGKPVEGAEIMIVPGRDNKGLSDSQGQFKITWSPRQWQDEGAVCYIVARYKAKNLGLALPIDNKAGTLQLTLKPAVSLSGKVVDIEGKAVSGVRLSIMLRTANWGQAIDSQSQTDGNGVFKFDALPVDNRYQLRAGADGYGQTGIYFNAEDAIDGHLDMGRIELAVANMSVTGQVVDVTGQPVPGIGVYCVAENQPSRRTKSDEQGYFVLDGICAGLVRIFAEGERVSCQILTEAGARNIKAVVTDNGYSRSRYIRTKSHEDIIKSGKPYIVGWVIDEDGLAVADVPVNVRCMQSKNEKGQDTESYFQFTKFGDVTDKQGRFAIEMEEEATYSLLFSPINHAAIIVYDVVPGAGDLKVVLPNGGTLTGQIVRFSRGRKVPVPDTGIELKQESRMSYSHIGRDRDRKTTTDSEGRFRFEHIRTLMRTDRQKPVFEPRGWKLSYEGASQTVMFFQGETVKNINLIIRPNLAKAVSLVGRIMPDYTGIDIDLSRDHFRDRKLLFCFFDYAQRPVRQCVIQLNRRLEQLHKQGVEIIAVQTAMTGENELARWMKQANISIPVVVITGDIDETRFIWGIKSLPWLILTDRGHKVVAEGFGLGELDAKIEEIGPPASSTVDSDKVTGLVKDSNGQVVSGVRITEYQTNKDYTTNADGRFVSAFGPSEEWRSFFAVDKQRKLVGVGRLPPGERHVEIKLTPGKMVSGTVVDPAGRPVAGAQVAPLPMTCFHVLTDKQGRFDVGWNPEWAGDLKEFFLMARHLERNLAEGIEIDEKAENVRIDLEPALILVGMVEDPNGVPIQGAEVGLSLRRGWACGTPVGKVVADENGKYEFPVLLQRQEYINYADAEGFWRNQIVTGIINRITDREQVGPIVLKRPILSVSGTVLHGDGEPVADIPVHLRGKGQPYLDTETDADGKFIFEKVCCGPVQISAKNDTLFGKIETEGGAKNLKLVVRPRFE
jgi:protocatechuate 3,4-dioxygenase beta subunit